MNSSGPKKRSYDEQFKRDAVARIRGGFLGALFRLAPVIQAAFAGGLGIGGGEIKQDLPHCWPAVQFQILQHRLTIHIAQAALFSRELVHRQIAGRVRVQRQRIPQREG